MTDSIWTYIFSPTSAFAGLFTYFTAKFFAPYLQCQKRKPQPVVIDVPVVEFSEEELDAISSALDSIGSSDPVDGLIVENKEEEEPESVSAPPEPESSIIEPGSIIEGLTESSSSTEQVATTGGFLEENRLPNGTLDLQAIRGLSMFKPDFSLES